MTAVVTFSWYFVLGPTLNQGGETLLAKTVGSAYPLCDLVLGFCLLLLVARSGSVHLRLATRILATGLVAIVVTDSVFDYQTLQGTYATGGLVDVGWPLGYMLICLGALAARATTAPETAEAERDPEAMAARSPRAAMPAWYSLAPYALVPLVGALMVYVGRAPGDPVVDPGVYIGGAVVIGVVLVRQILTIQENRQLHEETVAYAGQIRAAQDELQRKNEGLAEANVRLEALATTDPLTGLPNHRAMIAALDHEVERAHRYNRPFSLLFVDIDHFKTLNDTFGHSVGDDALREFASTARVALRGADILGRWGGEEFVAILPETDPDGAMDVAERLRSQTADSTLPTANGHRLTCSIGIAHFPNDAPDRGLLIERADRAMYAAKRLGRNQARLTSDPAVAALAVGTAAPEVADQSAMIGMVRALALLVEARDQSTGHHGDDVACLATELAQSLGLSDADVYVLRLAAWLHDIGKVAVPDAVLLKPARLTTEEWALMRAHPAVGADVVECVPGLRAIAPIIRAHHERWDGQGYPDGVAGAEIPLAARIICVADAFLTITSDRPYQRARSVEEARAEMRRCSGSQFDPEVVEALEALLEQKPPFLRAG
jgi:diguanylate cyclase (GGDEF)-like protein/putative nucleotidyltransferase with HDIG domain